MSRGVIGALPCGMLTGGQAVPPYSSLSAPVRAHGHRLMGSFSAVVGGGH